MRSLTRSGSVPKAWANDIANAVTLTEEQQQALHGVSTWDYQVWSDARNAAVAFLEEWGECLADDRRTALNAARELYQQEVEVFRSAREARDAFLGWDSFESLTDGAREREQEILVRAREIGSAAIAELEKAPDTHAQPCFLEESPPFVHILRLTTLYMYDCAVSSMSPFGA